MLSVPRIARALPHGPISRPETGLPVIARLRWASGQDEDVPAIAVAWTQDAVEIHWRHYDEPRADWIPAADVRRSLEEPVNETRRPPTSRGQFKNARR